jgi:hypothetical protein
MNRISPARAASMVAALKTYLPKFLLLPGADPQHLVFLRNCITRYEKLARPPKYMPHQGAHEIARRHRQIERGLIHPVFNAATRIDERKAA